MRWLHISDIHFTNMEYSTEILRKSLIEALKDMNIDLDFMLITGDCFYQNKVSKTTIKDLKDFIFEMERTCNIKQNHLYICQGNHDLNRSNQERNEIIENARTSNKLTLSTYNKLCDLDGENFQALFQSLRRNKVYEDYKVMEPRNLNVRIVSVNTCILSKDDNDYRTLRVCTNKLNELSSKLKDDNKLNILMMHHGIDWLQPDDARSFEHWIEDNHIDAVFCGHTHQAAVDTLNDVNRVIMQFTTGALLIDNYAIPSFYICESSQDSITVSLYTFSGKTEKWSLDTIHLRKFHDGGKHTFKLSRHAKSIENFNRDSAQFYCDQIIEELNKRYHEKFKSTKIYSNKSGEYEEFNAWKIVGSLAGVDIPYSVALKLACMSVEEITSSNFSSDNILESSELKQIIHSHILKAGLYIKDLNEYDICSWANAYAKHFDKEKGYTLIDGNRSEPISYALLNSSIIKEVIVSITKNEIYDSKLYKNERQRMAEQIMRFIKNLNIFEIKKEVLIALIIEFVTKSPRYWFVSDNRQSLINYNIKKAAFFIDKIEQEDMPLLQTEVAYHLFAAILARYDDYIGCTMVSPITILRNSVSRMGNKNDYNLPMRRYKLVQLKKDLEKSGIQLKDFIADIECVYKNCVERKYVTSEETAHSLLNIQNYLRKLGPIISEQWVNNGNVFDSVVTLFKNGDGLEVRNPLQTFMGKAFFVSAYWDGYQKQQYNLGKDIFICMIECNPNADTNKEYAESITLKNITEYISQGKREHIREICLFKDSFDPFTSEERKIIRANFSKNLPNKRCVFLQERDVQFVPQNGWRQEFFTVITKSRFS